MEEKVPLEVLRDLWLVRWGYETARLDTRKFAESEGWFRIARSLRSAGVLSRYIDGTVLGFRMKREKAND